MVQTARYLDGPLIRRNSLSDAASKKRKAMDTSINKMLDDTPYKKKASAEFLMLHDALEDIKNTSNS